MSEVMGGHGVPHRALCWSHRSNSWFSKLRSTYRGLISRTLRESRHGSVGSQTSLSSFSELWKHLRPGGGCSLEKLPAVHDLSVVLLCPPQWISLRELLVGAGRMLAVAELWALCYTCLSSLQTYTDFPGEATCVSPHNLKTIRTRTAADGGRR